MSKKRKSVPVCVCRHWKAEHMKGAGRCIMPDCDCKSFRQRSAARRKKIRVISGGLPTLGKHRK